MERAATIQDELQAAYADYQFHHVYQKLHNFCANDLGGVYLDIIKDRQYTTQADSLARRSAQTAMYHICEALVRWIAPILSFTAEEIWENLPGDRTESVMLEQWYTQLQTAPAADGMDAGYWDRVFAVRSAVNREMEVKRAAGELKGSLDAHVTLYCDGQLHTDLSALSDELRFVLITSAASLLPLADAGAEAATTELAGLRLVIAASEHDKCERCWHRRPDVGTIANHPGLCGRCVDNIDGDGERRRFA